MAAKTRDHGENVVEAVKEAAGPAADKAKEVRSDRVCEWIPGLTRGECRFLETPRRAHLRRQMTWLMLLTRLREFICTA